MKMKATKIKAMEKKFKRGTRSHEVKEDGSVFYYEDDKHKAKFEKRKEDRILKRQANREKGRKK